MNIDFEDEDFDDELAGLSDAELIVSEIATAIDKFNSNDEDFDITKNYDADKIEIIESKLMNGLRSELITQKIWDEMEPLVSTLLNECRADVKGYLFMVSEYLILTKEIDELHLRLSRATKDADKDRLAQEIEKCVFKRIQSLRITSYILKQNLSYISSDDKVIQQLWHDKLGSFFHTSSDNALFKSKASLFEEHICRKWFRQILEKMERNKKEKGVSFNDLGKDFYNLAPDKSKFLQPIYGETHHEFFDLLTKSIAPDEGARHWLLSSIAWKWFRPEETRLASPVHAGHGGSGKTGFGIVVGTTFGHRSISWSANITEDTMKNNGFMVGKVCVGFDDLRPIAKDSPEHQFIKKNCHNDTFVARDLFEKGKEIDVTAWCWFNGQNTNGEKCPVPLNGDGDAGVDRRLTPIIIRKSLVEVISEAKPEMTIAEVKLYIDKCFNTVCRSKKEVAKWLGNILVKYDTLNKNREDYPRAYHGADYQLLVGEKNVQLLNIFNFAFIKEQPDFVYLTELYDLYQAHCDECAVPVTYRKSAKNFPTAMEDLVTQTLKNTGNGYTYGRHPASKSLGQNASWVTGWYKDTASVLRRTVNVPKPAWTTKNGITGKIVMSQHYHVEDLSVPIVDKGPGIFNNDGEEESLKEMLNRKSKQLKWVDDLL